MRAESQWGVRLQEKAGPSHAERHQPGLAGPLGPGGHGGTEDRHQTCILESPWAGGPCGVWLGRDKSRGREMR